MTLKYSGTQDFGPQRYTDGGAHTIDGVWQVGRDSLLIPLRCDAAADCITDDPDTGTGVVAAELYTITPPTDAVGVILTFDWGATSGVDTNGDFLVPVANGAVLTFNATDDGVAVTRLTTATKDNGPGDYTQANGAPDTFAAQIQGRLALSWNEGIVTRLDLAFRENPRAAGAGGNPVTANLLFRRA